jgi:hypothetical protein
MVAFVVAVGVAIANEWATCIPSLAVGGGIIPATVSVPVQAVRLAGRVASIVP